MMNKLLQQTNETKQCKCIAVVNRRPENIGFVFRTQQEVETTETATPWTSEPTLRGVEAIMREEFKVKATGVDKLLVGDPDAGRRIDEDIVKDISVENDAEIQGMRMLSRPSFYPRIQLVVFCKSQREKERLLREGSISIQGAYVRIEEFFETPRSRRCFKCQGLNHNAADCVEEARSYTQAPRNEQ
jgi:hypothetical protein